MRERLRQWQVENPSNPMGLILDKGVAGATQNLLTRTAHLGEVSPKEEGDPSLEQPFADPDGSLDFLPPLSDFGPGDLVEFVEDGDRLSQLAVCLGHINGFYHFYLSTGKWVALSKLFTRFVVRDFVNEIDVALLVDKLPKEELSLETLWGMSKNDLGPDRVCGADVLRKMSDFQQKTEEFQQGYATRLEKAHELVAEGGMRYATLPEIYERVIGDAKRKQTSHPPPYELFAVYRSVMSDDVGFRPLATLGDSKTWLYEITLPEDVALIHNMETLVRLFTDIPAKVKTPLSSLTSSQLSQSQLGRFIVKAREAIDESRKSRDWTPHGILGPSKQDRPRSDATKWTEIDMSIMHFILLWAGHDQFSTSSRFHWIGSAVLRATGRYKDSEYLGTTAAWTFLQEVGYLTPWEIHDRYNLHLPGIKVSRERGFAPLPLGPDGIRPYLTQDVFDGRRHNWAGMKAFAIDSEDTTEVDDAVSIEATDVPSEHWVHIHVADPASRIRHQNALGERASLTPLTLYLPGHRSNIWGVEDQIQKLFSLAPNKPCLTFSGKVNEEGVLLDYKVTPGKLQDFIYMTPGDANTAVGFKDAPQTQEWSSTESFTVGKAVTEQPAERHMTRPSELQVGDRKSLKTLYRLGKIIQERRLANGAQPRYTTRPSANVSFDNTSLKRQPMGLMTCSGDPTINISWGSAQSPMVSSIMQLAGEIAGRWCADRKIPIPYSNTMKAEKNLVLAKAYLDKVYYPALLRGEQSPEMIARLQELIGPVELSTRPGRQLLMGVEAYTKVTSPLRRYSDLLAHWQIESALVQEMESGAVEEQRLPFARKDLEREVFPWLLLRQRVIRRLGNWAGTKSYILQAMTRAWKFPEESAAADSTTTSRLPETFKFKVMVDGEGSATRSKMLSGTLDWFSLEALMVHEGLQPLGLSLADLKKGDVLEVKLLDINVHQKSVVVAPTGKVMVQRDQEASQVEEVAEAQKKLTGKRRRRKPRQSVGV